MQGDLDLSLSQLGTDARAALQRCGYRCRQDFEGVSIADVCEDTGLPERVIAGFLRGLRGLAAGTTQAQTQGAATPPADPFAARGAVTFCQAFDAMMGGGIRRGRLTEIVGESGTGKTQLAMQLAVDVTIPTSFGGLDGSAVLIDTEGGVTLPRLRALAEALVQHIAYHAQSSPLTADEVLSRVHVVRVYDHHQLCAAVAALPHLLNAVKGGTGCKLVAVDSVAAPFRSWDCGADDPAAGVARQRTLANLGKRLSEASQRHGVAVVATNQTTHRLAADATSAFVHKATLGNLWSHEVTDSVLLTRDVTGTRSAPVATRTATIQKSPDLPQASCAFRIAPQGFRGA
eukprot:TRINITY_DN8879_c0_g1_i1.p1 TRINITY_DN8879_c0_g1~~TRINITY_DN8879_c0_g1_i1.p1  ORF type:complete len:366 (+),score=98.19 TRINITY_DN8879_c0_g1_i1:64-1098(+)